MCTILCVTVTCDKMGRCTTGCLVDRSAFGGNLETVAHLPEVARLTSNRKQPVQVVQEWCPASSHTSAHGNSLQLLNTKRKQNQYNTSKPI